VLFDVDGTLFLTHDEVYVEAARAAMREVYSTDAEGPDVPGDTATAHVRRALHAAGFGQAEIEAGLGDWCRSFSNRYVRLLAESDTSHWQLAPHAAEAVSAVERHALLTGNPQAVAHARMERLGLAALFPPGQGAFGCERESRTALFELARERAGNWPVERTVAVGDTPLDVSSAHDAGCLSVGVATGTYSETELSHADAVIADLAGLVTALATLAP
jgi:phosphoglycolate phosphatase-like HAD superfamily hydrolase